MSTGGYAIFRNSTGLGTDPSTRLFSEISKNWAGRPLDSWTTMLNYIRTTATKTGRAVKAHLTDTLYERIKITDEQIKDLPISRSDELPKWNYTLAPTT